MLLYHGLCVLYLEGRLLVIILCEVKLISLVKGILLGKIMIFNTLGNLLRLHRSSKKITVLGVIQTYHCRFSLIIFTKIFIIISTITTILNLNTMLNS